MTTDTPPEPAVKSPTRVPVQQFPPDRGQLVCEDTSVRQTVDSPLRRSWVPRRDQPNPVVGGLVYQTLIITV